MALNFKEILLTDPSNVVLDKINYNFDQILVNGGGPIGLTGPQGEKGFDGLTGDTGPQGAQGTQGPQGQKGDTSEENWKLNAGVNNDTIVPVHDASKTNAPTVMIGFDKNDPLYDVVIEETSLIINKKTGLHDYNVVLMDDGVTNHDGNFAYIDLSVAGDKVIKTEGFNAYTDTVSKKIASKFIFSNGLNDLVTIDANRLESNVNAKFSGGLNVNGPLKINIGSPNLNKVLAGTDTAGNATWKAISEIGGAVPVGTIIPVLTEVFDNANNFEQGAFLPSNSDPLRIFYGRGKGAYKGWYLSNGKTWSNASTGASYSTKDLCSFSYTITNNSERPANQGQGPIAITNSILALNGGADLEIAATYNQSAHQYTVTSHLDTSASLIYPATTGTPLDLYKMVYLVYLGHDNLYWEDAGDQGETQTNLVIPSVTLKRADTVWDSCATTTTGVYDISIPAVNPTYAAWAIHQANNTPALAWRSSSLNTEGPTGKVYLYQTGTTNPAPNGYYTIEGYSRAVISGVIFDNLTPAPCLENGDAQTCILPTATFDSISGPTSKSLLEGNTATLYAKTNLPSWRNTAQLTFTYQWQSLNDSTGNWLNIDGATSSTYTTPTLTPGSYSYRVGIITHDAATSTQSSTQYSTAAVASVSSSLVFFGATTVTASNPTVNSTLTAGSTATIELRVSRSFGPGTVNDVSASLIIQPGNYAAYANTQGTEIQTVTIPAGNYTYQLSVQGTNSGRNANIQ